MRIEIEVSQETLATVMDGRCVRLIRRLEHGWVRESTRNYKVYDCIPKELGTARVISILDREHQGAKEALMDRELDLIEFC